MKRIANKVAVTTICHQINGLQKIKIIDYESDYDMLTHQNGKIVYSGLLKNSCGYENRKWFDSECHGIRLENDVIVFEIFTKYEQY